MTQENKKLTQPTILKPFLPKESLLNQLNQIFLHLVLIAKKLVKMMS